MGERPLRQTEDVAAASSAVPSSAHGPARDAAAGPVPADTSLRDVVGASVSSDELDTPGPAAGIPGIDSGIDADSSVDAGRPSGLTAGSVAPDAPGSADEPAGGVAVATDPSELAEAFSVRSEDVHAKDVHAKDVHAGDARAEDTGDPVQARAADDAAGADDAETEEGDGSVIHLPDLSGPQPSEGDTGHNDILLRQIAEVVAASAGGPVGPADADARGREDDAPARRSADTPEDAPEHTEEATRDEACRKATGSVALPESRGQDDAIDPIGVEGGEEPGEPSSGHGDPDTPSRAGAAGIVRIDALLRDIAAAPSVTSDQPDAPDSAAANAVLDGGSHVRVDSPDDPGPPLHAVESVDPDERGSVDEPARGVGGPTNPSVGAAADSARSDETGGLVEAGPMGSDSSAERVPNERHDASRESRGDAASLPGSAAVEAGSSIDRTGPVEASVADSSGHVAGADDPDDAGVEEDVGSVIHLPDLSAPLPSGADAGPDDDRVRQIADTVAASAGDAVEPSEAAYPGSDELRASGPAVPPGAADAAAVDDRRPGDAGVVVLPGPDDAAAPERPLGDGSRGQLDEKPSAPAVEAGTAAATAGIVFDDTLVLDLGEVQPVSSDEGDAPGSAFDVSLPDRGTGSPDPTSGDDADDFAATAVEATPPGPAAALAFATDPDTEMALRDGLLGFGGASTGTDEPQVWQGGLRAAIAALAEGRSAPLVIVDIDGLAYPAGAIHELAAVCEVGTVVIAVGSDASARPGRELLLAGVSDYLAKPLTAAAVRGVAARALADAVAGRPGGLVAGFVGCGGSGATTLATAAALHAAARGCYVSVLDLSRSVPAAALSLGVDPVAGLDQLLETAAKVTVEPDSLDGVCARRSDRIEVYAHRWSPEHPAAATADAVDGLLAVLRLRSQLVLVDGLDEAWTRILPAAEIDTRVFVAEPAAGKTPHLARMLNLLGGDRPVVFVQNHTRAFRRDAGTRALRDAGLGVEPDLAVPFDPALPETADWGWPQGRLPRSVRKPVAALTDRLLGASSGAYAASPASARAA